MKLFNNLFVFVALAGGLVFLSACSNNQVTPASNLILFYGDGCPHCAIVETYIKDHKIEEKITFDKKEVFNDQVNAALLGEKAAACGLPTDRVGVPFLWDNGQCYEGDQDIIKYFKEKNDEK